MRKYAGAILSAVAVTAIAALYVLFIFRVIGGDLNGARWARIVVTLAAGFVGGGVIIAMISRIRELRTGQEDAISKY